VAAKGLKDTQLCASTQYHLAECDLLGGRCQQAVHALDAVMLLPSNEIQPGYLAAMLCLRAEAQSALGQRALAERDIGLALSVIRDHALDENSLTLQRHLRRAREAVASLGTG
jgi:hypothetical protein